MNTETTAPLCSPDAAAISYTLLRHLGLMLDELSAQGLEVWQDERRAWHWRWASTDLHAGRGFWALGEALVDGVVARYPGAFGGGMVEQLSRYTRKQYSSLVYLLNIAFIVQQILY